MLNPNYADYNISSSNAALDANQEQMTRHTFVTNQSFANDENSNQVGSIHYSHCNALIIKFQKDLGLGYNEELLKMWFKREKNRLAATKCR